MRIGREGKSAGCGHPPSIARSQKAGTGILGNIPNGITIENSDVAVNITKEKQPFSGLLFFRIK